jgi:NAD(P)-dependent dehydrogenase (short-subunit alcohol dehydrogenase family)
VTNVIVVIGAGSIGQAIARRISSGKHVPIADLSRANTDAASKVLSDAGFEVSTAIVDVCSRTSVHALVETATAIGTMIGVIPAAGVSPPQASPPSADARENKASAITPVDELLDLPTLQPHRVTDPLNASQVLKRGTSLRVMAEAVRWGKRGARVNIISSGIIFTPLAKDELAGPRGAGYRRTIELASAGRGGTPDEVGAMGAFLMGPGGAFITGSESVMDGGVTAAYGYGELASK